MRPVADKTKNTAFADTLIECEDFILTKLAVTVSGLLDDALATLGLRLRHHRLLLLLQRGGACAQSAIGPALGIDRTSVVSLVDDLERRGAVKRMRCEDRRAYFVGLTPAGRKLASKALARVVAAEKKIYAPLSAAERKTLRRLAAQVLLGISRSH